LTNLYGACRVRLKSKIGEIHRLFALVANDGLRIA
jgi:hypothetical protein